MKSVLIIEDEPSILNNIFTILQISGYSCVKASSSAEGLKLLSDKIPDIILCDVMMPQMDGFEVLRNVRLNLATQNIPLCFLSARADVVDIDYGLSIGANGYITKPFSAKDLIETVGRLIG
jgi:hypothetical protein